MALVPFLFGATGRTALPGPVLRRLLGDLGLSADAGRALLSRMGRHGQLTSERRGRCVEYRLSGEFAESFERVRTQAMTRPAGWTGSYHALLYQVPEHHRTFRDALRRAAVLSGYGVLQQGVLISPTDRSSALAQWLADRPPGAEVWLSHLTLASQDAARAAATAWDLPDLARTYRQHIDRLCARLDAGTTAPTGPRAPALQGEVARLRDYTHTLLPILIDTLREPVLPKDLLPDDWPGPRLRTTLDEYTATFEPAIQAYLRELLHPAPTATPRRAP